MLHISGIRNQYVPDLAAIVPADDMGAIGCNAKERPISPAVSATPKAWPAWLEMTEIFSPTLEALLLCF